jgi:hypothetical protein
MSCPSLLIPEYWPSVFCTPSSVELLLKPPRRILYELQCRRLLNGRQQFRRVTGMLFDGRESNGKGALPFAVVCAIR